MKIVDAVELYQCTGCMNGPNPKSCPKTRIEADGCQNHAPGTMGLAEGNIALGLPRGFCRFGPAKTSRIEVWKSYEALIDAHQTVVTVYSLPIWKHLDEHGNTIIRWFSPRVNYGWSNVILGDCRDKLPGAIEITQEQINYMD